MKRTPKPSPLTREFLQSGDYIRSFAKIPGQWWTREQLEASLDHMLAQRPDPFAPVWIFAYGSLIWNPLIHTAEQQQATLRGWHRSFCMKLTAGRGTPEQPGRMLALARGREMSATTGIAFRLREEELREELLIVWMREMIGGTYLPLWQDVRLADGRLVQSIVFVMTPAQPWYETDTLVATVAPIIANATGHLGHNIDYLLELDDALASQHIHDPYISDLIAAVRAYGSDI